MKRLIFVAFLFFSIVLFTGCVEDEPPKATTLELLSGDNQAAFSSMQLVEPIVVFVSDQNGDAFQGASVEVFTRFGFVNPMVLETNDAGEAEFSWTLGDWSGEQDLTIMAVDENDQALRGAPLRVSATAVIDTLSTIVFCVLDGNEQIQGANIYINDKTLRPTDERGLTDTALVLGTYTYVVDAEGYETFKSNLQISFKQDRNILQQMKKLYNISCYVSDESGPVTNVQIKINGQPLTMTDDSGRVDTTIVSGLYYYEVQAYGYVGLQKTSFYVNGDTDLEFKLKKKRLVSFSISDGMNPIEGASININGEGLHVTGDDGGVELLLINGDYNFTLAKDGYEYSGELSFSVNDADLEIPLIMDELFQVDFTITANDRIVGDAVITFENGRTLRTSKSGQVSLKLIDGEYHYAIKADYYLDSPDNVLVVAGQAEDVYVQLPYLMSISLVNPPKNTVLPMNASLGVKGMCLKYVWSDNFTEDVYDDAFDAKGIVVPSAQVMGNEAKVLHLSHKVSDLTIDQNYTFATLTDIENNVYPTTKIGEQVWMAADLRTTRYPNGTSILFRQQGTPWYNLDNTNGAAAYSTPLTDHDGVMVKGVVYSYGAAIAYDWHYDKVDGQGICPDGWHLPKNKEWIELNEHITNDGFRNNEGKALKSKNAWRTNAGIDHYGFNALPAQDLFCTEDDPPQGPFVNSWWSAFDDESDENEYPQIHALYWAVSYDDQMLESNDVPKSYGFSVRCIKNE